MGRYVQLVLAAGLAVSACGSDGTGPGAVALVIEGGGGAVLLPCETRQIAVSSGAAVQWRSDAPDVITVSSTGLVTGRAPGQARVFASLSSDTSVTGSIQMSVSSDMVSLQTEPIPTDTIGAVVEGGITAALSWAPGCPGRQALVRYVTEVATEAGGGLIPAVWFESVGQSTSNVVVDLRTDDQGSVTMLATRSTAAGTFFLEVSEPASGVSEIIPVEILAGAPHFIDLSVRDTAIYLGDSYSVAGGVLRDRAHNVLPATGGFSSSSESVVSVDTNGLVTATGHGRAGILWSGSHLVANVSVVPPGMITASPRLRSSADLSAVVQFALNGSRRRTLYQAPTHYNASPRAMWHPTQPLLVMAERDAGGRFRISTVDTAGSVVPLSLPSVNLDAVNPGYSKNGDWIYFTYDGVIYRVRTADTSDVQMLGGVPMVPETTSGSTPSFSPDGTHLVVHDERGVLHVVNAETGLATSLGIQGMFPAWHPTQDVIAYVDGGSLWTVSSNGSGARRITPPESAHGWGLVWSPDGDWLATVSDVDQRIHVVAADNGTSIPLPFTEHFFFPSWR